MCTYEYIALFTILYSVSIQPTNNSPKINMKLSAIKVCTPKTVDSCSIIRVTIPVHHGEILKFLELPMTNWHLHYICVW